MVEEPAYTTPGVHELILKLKTGGDDLRGGNDNINATVKLWDGTEFNFPNINHGARWVANSDETARLVLPEGVAKEDLWSVTLENTFGGGIAGDNWDMNELKVDIFGLDILEQDWRTYGYFRFTGEEKRVVEVLNTRVDWVDKLEVGCSTGGDDLRGGNDNLNIQIELPNGDRTSSTNVNKGKSWDKYSWHTVIVPLNRPISRWNLSGTKVTLKTTFSGGWNGDNWDMDAAYLYAFVGVSVDPKVPSTVEIPVAYLGSKRFTGSDGTLVITIP